MQCGSIEADSIFEKLTRSVRLPSIESYGRTLNERAAPLMHRIRRADSLLFQRPGTDHEHAFSVPVFLVNSPMRNVCEQNALRSIVH
jgi:hypothetical protein